MKLYDYLSQDRLYSDPMKNVIFLDNHDTERFFTLMGENKDKFRMAYGVLMTIRGIPQVYYGTEFMLPNADTQGDSRKRPDMVGGWPEEVRSVFNKADRTPEERDNYDFVKKLTNWRKTSEAIHKGKTVHFVPENNVYVYFRFTEDDTVMVIVNASNEDISLDTDRFEEFLSEYSGGREVVGDSRRALDQLIRVKSLSTQIIELIE